MQIELKNPAVEYENARKAVHKAIKSNTGSSDYAIRKWLDMTAGEYYTAIDTVRYWNGQEFFQLPILLSTNID